jgi:hypothetical protein
MRFQPEVLKTVTEKPRSPVADVRLRMYSSDDIPQIIEILKLSFPDWRMKKDPVSFWRWKYLKPPFGSYVYVLDLDGKVLGIAHLLFLKIKLGSLIVTGQYSDDDAIHPDYRGKGLYNMFSGVRQTTPAKVSYWISSNPINIRRAQRKGRRQLPFINSKMLRIKDIGLYLRENKMDSTKAQLGLTFLKTINVISNRFNQRNSVTRFQIEDVEEFDQRIDLFLEKIHENIKMMIFKDRGFLNWRYCDQDAGEIIVRQIVHENKILGYLALELKENKGHLEGYVLDLQALPDRPDAAEALFKELCLISDRMDLNTVHYRVIKGHPFERLAGLYGFIDVTQWSDIRIYINESEGAPELRKHVRSIEAYSPGQAHFTYGDII